MIIFTLFRMSVRQKWPNLASDSCLFFYLHCLESEFLSAAYLTLANLNRPETSVRCLVSPKFRHLVKSSHKKWSFALRIPSVNMTKSNPQFPAYLVKFTEEILNEKLHFCAVKTTQSTHLSKECYIQLVLNPHCSKILSPIQVDHRCKPMHPVGPFP